ncbi:hypothetical protein ACFT2C_18220 [Promicromonospora sp. NPDC057138]|uniref:hypothetical protein n=1 Tax=Promicromonospora sp. NPDC057138 TaxID=3346031 RepID=UPI00362F4EA2
MTITLEALLSGWRGRRLLLELALRSEALLADQDGADVPLASATMRAAYDLDPGRGTSVVSFGWGGHDAELTAPTSETVAALLDEIRVADAEQGSALRALADVVANARYWQEPDGEDLLAATPVVRAALGRVADHVAGATAAAVGWWSEPLARGDQHAVAWDVDARRAQAGGAAGAADLLARWRADVLKDERRAERDTPADPTASFSGRWWSTPPSDLTHTTRSLGRYGPAGLWLVEDGMGWERAVTRRVAVPAEARVYEIDGPDAWAALCRAHPLDVTAQKRHDWYRTTGRAGRWVMPDWATIAVEHDAVHLTAAAYLAAAGTAIPVDGDTCSVIAGWNPDETYWFADAVRPEKDGAVWVLDDEDWVSGV